MQFIMDIWSTIFYQTEQCIDYQVYFVIFKLNGYQVIVYALQNLPVQSREFKVCGCVFQSWKQIPYQFVFFCSISSSLSAIHELICIFLLLIDVFSNLITICRLGSQRKASWLSVPTFYLKPPYCIIDYHMGNMIVYLNCIVHNINFWKIFDMDPYKNCVAGDNIQSIDRNVKALYEDGEQYVECQRCCLLQINIGISIQCKQQYYGSQASFMDEQTDTLKITRKRHVFGLA